jgi:hypothetical protein
MIAIYETDQFGSSLTLYDSTAELEDDLPHDQWTSRASDLTEDGDLDQITKFIEDRLWQVRGDWAYDEEHDVYRATVHR